MMALVRSCTGESPEMSGVLSRCIRGTLPVLLALAALHAVPARSQAVASSASDTAPGGDFSLFAGGTWGDNVTRVPVNPVSDTIATVGATWAYERQGPRINADIDLDTSFERYMDSSFEDRIAGGLNANLGIALVPDYIDWLIQDNFGQLRLSPREVSTPDNLQNTNFLTTGPRLTARLGRTGRASLSGTFSQADFETTAIDNRTYTGAAEISRDFSGLNSLGLNVLTSKYEYEDALATTYDRREATLQYSLNAPRTVLNLAVGQSEFDGDLGTFDGTIGRLRFQRDISTSTSLSLWAVSQFSTTTDAFRQVQEQFGVQRDPELVVPTLDVIEERSVALRWEFARLRTSLALTGEYRDEAYRTQRDFDRELGQLEASMSRALSRAVSATLTVGGTSEKFELGDVTAEELYGIVSLGWRIGASLSLSLQFERIERTSTLVANEYKLNRAGLFVTWSPTAPR